jgi:hypothetical protein
MLTSILTVLISVWKIWADLFVFLPYGDPYVASISLSLLVAVVVHVCLRIKQRAAELEETPEMKQHKLYCRVMNLN